MNCEERLWNYSKYGDNCILLQQALDKEIEKCTIQASKDLILSISQCIIHKIVENDNSQIELYKKWREFAVDQGKMR